MGNHSIIVALATLCCGIAAARSVGDGADCDTFEDEDVPEASKSSRIVIIGAGASGLAAADRLLKAGFSNVKILEATERFGGRIKSAPAYSDASQPGFVEMGAQWIHGNQSDNIAFKIANGAGLVNLDRTEDDIYEHFVFEGEGAYLNQAISDAYEELIEGVEEGMEDYIPEPGQSYGAYVDEKFEDLSIDFDSEEKKYYRPIKDWYHRHVRSHDGADNWYSMSYKGTAIMFEETEGNQLVSYKADHKYEDLIGVLQKDIPADVVQLSAPVATIDYNDSDSITITTESGEEFDADFVIVTVSLGFLKQKARAMFHPALPIDKLKAIDTIGFGVVNKIFLEFTKPLRAETDGINLLFNDNGISYNAGDAAKDWTRFIMVAYKEERPKIVSLWLSGAGAKKMESLSDEQVKADVMKLLRHFLVDMEEFQDILEEPISIKRSNWATTPYVFGSYSYQTIESELAKVGPETLAKPAGDNRILFAGEATHERYFSTVHGAIESGIREADRLICGLAENK